MKLDSVQTKNKKRPGRGISAGQGKTAGRGTKGQKSRSGFNIPNRFEGGQTPLSMRLPKLPGFKSLRKKAEIISLDQISKNFKDGDVVTLDALEKRGLIRVGLKAKILNNGKLTIKVSLGEGVKVSEKIAILFISDLPKGKNAASIKDGAGAPAFVEMRGETLPEKAKDQTPEIKKDETPVKENKSAPTKKSATKATISESTKIKK